MSTECNCYRCLTERNACDAAGWPIALTRMILCPTCGCKRCPHSTDHRLVCTDSNEPGQPGSRYSNTIAKRDSQAAGTREGT